MIDPETLQILNVLTNVETNTDPEEVLGDIEDEYADMIEQTERSQTDFRKEPNRTGRLGYPICEKGGAIT